MNRRLYAPPPLTEFSVTAAGAASASDVLSSSSLSSSAAVTSDVLVKSSRFNEFNNSFGNDSRVVTNLKTFSNSFYVESGTKTFYTFSGNITTDDLARMVQERTGIAGITVIDLGGGEGEVAKKLNEMGCSAFSISFCNKEAPYNISADLHDLNSTLDTRPDINKPNLVISKFTFNFLKDPLKVLQDIYNRSAPRAILMIDNVILFGLSAEDGGWALFNYLRNQGYIIHARYNKVHAETEQYCLNDICIYIEKTHSDLVLPIDRVGTIKLDQSVKKPLCIETYFYAPNDELKSFFLKSKSSIATKESAARKNLAALIAPGPDRMTIIVEKIVPWGRDVLSLSTEIEYGRFNHLSLEEARNKLNSKLTNIANIFAGENNIKAINIIQSIVDDLLSRISFAWIGYSADPAAAPEIKGESKLPALVLPKDKPFFAPRMPKLSAPPALKNITNVFVGENKARMPKSSPSAATHAVVRSMHEFFKVDPITFTLASHSRTLESDSVLGLCLKLGVRLEPGR